MPSTQPDLKFSEEQKQLIADKDITEDEVADCIGKELENGKDQEQAIAICLSKLESGNSEPSNTDSLENPRYSTGDFVEWEFADGTSQGEVIDRKTEVGDSMSAGGNTFTIEEGDGPLYKMVEWDETEGEDGEYTNNVVKFEDSLSSADRPAAAERSKGKDKELSMQERIEMARNNQDKIKRVNVSGKDVEVISKDNGETKLQVPVQALSQDRDGDFLDENGQNRTIKQLESGTVPLFPNHGVGEGEAMYDFRDIFGRFDDGEMMNETTVGEVTLRRGQTEVDADELHPMGKELVNLLDQNMPVGFSIGFIPRDTEPMESGEGEQISDLDLMEVSAVGIPSNPDAMPNAMNQAASQTTAIAAKQMMEAGFDKNEIVDNVRTALNDTMTDKNDSDGQEQNNDSKSEIKQLDEEQVEQVTSVVGTAVNDHMTAALEDIQEELASMEQDGDEEDSDMDEDSEHNEDEQQDAGEPEETNNGEGSDQNGDPGNDEGEKDGGSAESEKQENEGSGLSEDEKTVNSDDSGRTMTTINNNEDNEESKENQEQESSDPFKVRETLQN